MLRGARLAGGGWFGQFHEGIVDSFAVQNQSGGGQVAQVRKIADAVITGK